METLYRAAGRLLLSLGLVMAMAAWPAGAEPTGYAAKRPIIAGACTQCVWGPLAEFVKKAMAPEGYDIQICYNCNEADSPRYVAKAMHPHALTPEEIAIGDTPPPQGPVDFGVTEAQMLLWDYHGQLIYAHDGPQPQLRLIALIEDPVYILVAAKKGSGITDLAQLRDRKAPLNILTDGGPQLQPLFEYYGITKQQVEAKGGHFDRGIMSPKKDEDFDLIVSSLGGDANNFEANVWTQMSQKYDLVYFPIPQDLRARMAGQFGMIPVELPAHYLRGVDHAIATLGRSGHVIYGRADMPDDFAYALAKAIDEHRSDLRWYIRPFSYDSRTVWKDGDVPLHPGAERYYREVGYIK